MKTASAEIEVVSMRCLVAGPGAAFPWHTHPFEEFTLVTDDDTTIGYPPGKKPMRKNTLLFYHRGERHGAWCAGRQTPRFWVVHFAAPPALFEDTSPLAGSDPARRVWRLSAVEVETFKWFFLQILSERTRKRSQSALAQAAWLRLLLVHVQRWAEGENAATVVPPGLRSELMQLWHLVNASVGQPEAFLEQIHRWPNYDSLRHGFKEAFGCSPREMLLRLRMQHAKNLLLETSLTVKEIAALAGYPRQHEFTRAFHEKVGMPPSAWRIDPFPISNRDSLP